MSHKISDERRLGYYIGAALTVIGVLLFLSVFVSVIGNFGNFNNFDVRMRSGGMRAFVGIVLIMVGQLVRTVAARGLAGSGVVLDPQRAKEELAPYSRMAGGLVKDALDEADIRLGAKAEVVKIRCQSCSTLNDEDAKFCKSCSKPI